MKYTFVVYTEEVANAVIAYATRQFVFEVSAVKYEEKDIWEIEVDCTPHHMERIFGFLDGLLHLQ